jgi:hypothetical protein
MVDSEDPIPPNGVFLLDAFEYLYRASTPNWQIIEERCDPARQANMGLTEDEIQKALADAWDDYDCAQLKANKLLRSWLVTGTITAYIRDPDHNSNLQLSRNGWDNIGLLQSGITSNFVGPDDLFDPGPNTVLKDARRPVFFIREDFEQTVRSELKLENREDTHTGAPGRPSSRNLVELELNRRIAEDRPVGNATEEAKSLAQWLATKHKECPLMTAKTILNVFRNKIQDYVRN